jgi:hypothetical protein
MSPWVTSLRALVITFVITFVTPLVTPRHPESPGTTREVTRMTTMTRHAGPSTSLIRNEGVWERPGTPVGAVVRTGAARIVTLVIFITSSQGGVAI